MPLLEQIQEPIGSSGFPLVGNQSWRSDEYNVDLASPQQAVATYEQMRRSDAKVRSSINHLLYAIMSAQWRVDAQQDDPQGEEIAAFVRSVLMPGETYGYPGYSSWIDTLRNILTAPVFGFSVLEKIWGWRPSDGKQVIAAFELRKASSISNWTLETNGPSRLKSVTQYAQNRNGNFGEVTIPAKSLIVYPFNREGDNFWGESILRPAHFHWRRKRDLLKFDAIQKERIGGIFWVTSKENTSPTPEQIAAAKTVVANFRIHQNQGLYFPNVFDFHAVFPTGQSADFIGSVRYDDEQIEQSMFSQFQSMGTGEKGALSVGEIQLDMMLLAYQGVAKAVEDVFSGDQCIVQLVDTNFGPRELYPRLVCENFLQMKPDRLASVVKPLLDAGVIRIDQPLRVYFREKYSLPPEDEVTLEPSPSERAAASAAAQVNQPGGDPGNQPPNAAKRQALRKAAPSVAPGYFMRDALPHETGVAWDQLQRHLDHAPQQIWYRDVLPVRQRQIKALAAAAAGASEGQLAQGAIPKPEVPELAAAILPGLLDSYRAGRQTVLDEAKRARGGVAKAAVTDAQDLEDEYPPDPTAKQSTWIKRLAQGLALGMTLNLVKEAVRSGQAAQDQELSPAEKEVQVRLALEALSVPMAQADLAGKVTQAFTTGRVEQGQDMQSEVSSIFYSAIMDSGTCGPCAAMDGAELDSESWSSDVPNPNCDGGDRCRCVPVFVWRAQAEAA
jgi:hypothetical protein